MSVVIEVDTYSLKYENVLSIGRGFVANGQEVKMWNSQTTPFLDMIYELKPSIVFYTSELNERAVKNLSDSVRLVNTETFTNSLIADTVSYTIRNPHPTFGGEVCILKYPEIESTEDRVLKERMSIKNTSQFRLFSIKPTSGSRYCGWLPQELHPLILSSATSVLALSKHSAINASLCNRNVKLSVDGKETPFSVSQKEIDALSNVTIAQAYMKG